MTMDNAAVPPAVIWAQRKAVVLLTFNVECKEPDIKFEKKSVIFKGICDPDKMPHEVTIPLYAEILPEQCVQLNKGRCIEVILAKENKDAPFWPALTSDKKKYHWLKVDFNKWQDEEDNEEGDGRNANLEDFMSSLYPGGPGGGGGGEENAPFDVESDSDDEEGLPDLE